MYDIYYIGAQNSEKIDFCQWPYMVTGGDVFDGSYDEIEDDDHIQGFEKKITSKKLNIEIAKTGLITLPQAIDNLESVTEKDIIAATAGKLYVGNSYMKCWIRGTAKDRWIADLDRISNELEVITDYPYWITEEEFRFHKQGSESSEALEWLEFPYDVPYEVSKVRNLQYINNNNYAASGFKMIIYGPCINPLIRIAGHVYELRTTLYDGEYAVIDSSTRYAKDRKIIKAKADGTEENLFNSKNNESSIWEKIPAGLSIVSWNGSFGFDIILFNERGTPRWTLRSQT